VRLKAKVWSRNLADWRTGDCRRFAGKNSLIPSEIEMFQGRIQLSQALKNTSYSENKRHNLKTAIASLENRPIYPGEIFSFWHWVGEPNRQNGYREGRAIVNDELRSNIGGGLCQLSGIIYFLMLKAGIRPQERHPHSQDIYTEETRFTPLGSDATVVYGYKDLRFKNILSVPICFRFTLLETEIIAFLCSVQDIKEWSVEFKVAEIEAGLKKVETFRFSESVTEAELVDSTIYPTRI
jgi:vancomycin resistance protein VanW